MNADFIFAVCFIMLLLWDEVLDRFVDAHCRQKLADDGLREYFVRGILNAILQCTLQCTHGVYPRPSLSLSDKFSKKQRELIGCVHFGFVEHLDQLLDCLGATYCSIPKPPVQPIVPRRRHRPY